MFCMHCGAKLTENAAFCTNCGKPSTTPTKAESHDFIPNEPTPKTTQGSPPQDTTSEKPELSALRKIIGKNANYYLAQFEELKANNPSKYNWAACLGGLLHAAYRGIWKQWFLFMKIPLLSFAGSLLLGAVGSRFSSPTAIMITGILAFLSSVLSFVWQAFRYPKQFNRIYFEHITRKVSAGDERPDPSVGRVIASLLACIALSFLISLLTTFASVSMLGAALEEDPFIFMEQSSGITAPEVAEEYDAYSSNPPTYANTGNSLLGFLEQNELGESKWISGTDYDSPAFSIQKTKNGTYFFTFHEDGLYFRTSQTPVELFFLEGKSYAAVSLINLAGQSCEVDLNYEEENGIPLITLTVFSDTKIDIPDTYYCEAYVK